MKTLFTVRLRFEHDVVIARQRAREVASALGFGTQDQIRIATAVSELARLAFGGRDAGEIVFSIQGEGKGGDELWITVRGADSATLAGGDGAGRRALAGARRLLDHLSVDDRAGRVEACQVLPGGRGPDADRMETIRRQLLEQDPTNPFEELQHQNEDLVNALAELREREAERTRLLEAEREAREKAQRAVQDREEVLSIVSHDLRNPVGAILTGVQFLLENPELLAELAGGGGKGAGRRQLEAIRRSAERAERLIRDLLDASSMEGGKLSVRRQAEPVGPILAEVEDLHATRAAEGGLRLRVAAGEGVPQVCGDRARLVQALSNLVGNALKFTPKDGQVRLEAHREGEHVVFLVADTGPGIAPEDRDHLFDRFWQSPGHSQGGAGLGLAIVKGIVEGHDGWIDLDTGPGEGTRFRLGIPVAAGPCPPAEG